MITRMGIVAAGRRWWEWVIVGDVVSWLRRRKRSDGYSEVESGASCGGVVVCKESQNTAGQFGC